MRFSEKLIRLRRREGLSQEALAEALGVSRQAVSRWEQGTALPDGGKLLPCARYFGVSVDWMLDDTREWEDQRESARMPEKKTGGRIWIIAGAVVLGLSLTGMLLMGIFSSVFPAAVSVAPVGKDWVQVYTGLLGFLKFHHLEWLFALCLLTAFAGLWMLLRPRLQRAAAGNPILRRNLVILPIAMQAGLLYSAGQCLWWINQGREDYWGPFWFSLVPLFFASIWMVRNLLLEPDRDRRRKNCWIELGYCTAQLAVGVLVADAGVGLVGLAMHIILCYVYILWVNPRYMGRPLTKP